MKKKVMIMLFELTLFHYYFVAFNTMLPSVVCFVSLGTTMHTTKVFIETVKYQLV